MEDSSRNPSVTGLPATYSGLRNGLEEQQEILKKLSQELDNYFSLRGFGKNE